MLPAKSLLTNSTGSPPIRMDIAEITMLKDNISSRIKKVSNCCDPCRHSWGKWKQNIDQIITCVLQSNHTHDAIPTIVNKINENRKLAAKFTVDAPYLAAKKIQPALKNPFEIIKNHEYANQFFSRLDDGTNNDDDIKEYRNHLYSKLIMSRTNAEQERTIHALHTLIHREYNSDNNKYYPLMKTDGKEYHVKHISKTSSGSDSKKIRFSSEIKEFISHTKTHNERANLYDKYLTVRRFNNDDKLPASESSLKQQYGVFAKDDIPANTCIGVHGGTILTIKKNDSSPGDLSMSDLFFCINMDYLVNIEQEENMVLDGKNTISKINSKFYQLASGKWQEERSGFNVESVFFNCTMSDGKKLKLDSIFTTQVIKKGEEIRLNYNYSEKLVEKMMQTQNSVSHTNIEELTSVLRQHLDR